MGVVVTAHRGVDLDYVWLNQGQASTGKSPGGYYIDAAQGGEPPGLWWGPGAAALGFEQGTVVERETYTAVYRQSNPATGEKLGRAAGNYQRFADHYARLRDAEPHATAERLLELEREAAQATRHAAAYTDMTVSFSKSISVFHASLRENERRARLRGDTAGAAVWAEREQRFAAVLQDANRAGLAHVQEWAGITRTGYHGAKVGDKEPGRYEPAGLVVTSWLQGTSRDGDPQDHIHNQIARMVQTWADGKWRALDTVSLRGQLGAVQAIVAAHAEAGLTREFGVEWTLRADGRGAEISGVTQAQMDAYSSRTQTITGAVPEAVRAWTAKYGCEPNQRQLMHIRAEVTVATRQGKDAGVIDWDTLCAAWDATIGGDLAAVAPRVADLRAGDTPRQAGPAQAELRAAAVAGLAAVQAGQSTWTRSDLIKAIGLNMPASARTLTPGRAVELLHETADAAIAGRFGPVVCLEAGQWPALPGRLIRETDGRSVYTRPGTARYATRGQLRMEERLLADAQAGPAPVLEAGISAARLGAGAGELTARLADRAAQTGAVTGSGLRLDQAAALQYVLTSPRTGEVLIGPAGSGKTRTLAEAARAWLAAGNGTVIGLATAQAARNVLETAGVDLAENTSVFLGHSPARRGARGIRDLPPGSLILIDEASMMSMADLGDIMAYAARGGHKVIIAGDQEQLAAVEGGGGLMLLARRLGYVQLAEAVRFDEQWERDASLRLRDGDPSALDDYHAHGRIRGGDPDRVMDETRKMYVAEYLTGADVELICWERERCRDMSRRIRDDLVHLGVVGHGRQARLAAGAVATAGDLIICRENDHSTAAGEPGRTLANGDVLRIDQVGDGQVIVRRAIDRDPETGERRWTAPFTWTGHGGADLGYAVTAHSAQGRTVAVSLPLVTGAESRQWLYSAMTRGARANIAHVFTTPAKPADPKPGTRTAPALDQYEHAMTERAGLPPEPGPDLPDQREPIAVLADVVARDGTEMSALETQRENMAAADHLAMLNAMWVGETAGPRAEGYRAVVRAALPPGMEDEALSSRPATWLWRTLRCAEAAGLDPAGVVSRAVGAGPLGDARDVAAVIDSRARAEVEPLIPLPARPWSQQVPEIADPELAGFVTDLAAAMDARAERIGEHAADTEPGWALIALGPVPDDPLDRLGWQAGAAAIGGYRELYAHDHPSDPVGPEPSANSPEQRAAWQAAFAAVTRTGQADVRSWPDRSLRHARGTYESETAWAPPHTGVMLRQARAGEIDARVAEIRAAAEARTARAAGEHEVAARHEASAASARAARAEYAESAGLFAAALEDREQWARLTEGARHLAVSADSELRRRHPGEVLEPLRSAEPGNDAETDWAVLLPATHDRFTEAAAERAGVMVPAEDPDYEDEGEAWPAWPGRDRDAILQPPKPAMPAAPEVAAEYAEREAGR